MYMMFLQGNVPFSSNRGRNNTSYDSTNPFTVCVKINGNDFQKSFIFELTLMSTSELLLDGVQWPIIFPVVSFLCLVLSLIFQCWRY